MKTPETRVKKAVFVRLLFFACFAQVLSSFSPDIEYLKIGCFVESPTNREFPISPGDYQPWKLTPYDCLRLCGKLSFNFAALQNGNLCFCARNFNGTYGASSDCNKTCTGDGKFMCGGTWANSVYNASFYAKTLNINHSSPLLVFELVNLTAGYLNESDSGLRVRFNIGDETGESPGQGSGFNFRATVWGKVIVTARPFYNNSSQFGHREIHIHARPARPEIQCPEYVQASEEITCVTKIYEGSLLEASWQFQYGTRKNISLPDPLYTKAGTAVPQWVVPGVTSDYIAGLFLIPSFHFSHEARILALELYGHTAGDVKIIVVRPVCISSKPYFCVSSQSCSSLQCPANPRYPCILPDIFCATHACCYHTSRGNCSTVGMASVLSTNNFRVNADLGVFKIKQGYNFFAFPKDKVFDVLPGDMVGWTPASDGKIAQQRAQTTVYHFPGIDATTIKVGNNLTSDQSVKLPGISYMINMIGSQASTFILNHRYNSSGVYWAQVNFTNPLGNAVTLDSRVINVQAPIKGIVAQYPRGFSFFGAEVNKSLGMTVNISTDSFVTVTWSFINSSSELQRNTANNTGQTFALDRLNYTFNCLGTHILLVEAWNNVSTVNISVIVNVQEPITNLSAYLVSSPAYLGIESTFRAWARGENVHYKWIFGNDENHYTSNESVHYYFPRIGDFNVTAIASNLASSLEKSFTVNVLQPLIISVPSQVAIHSQVNSTCALTGPFPRNQYFYWDFGDGSREEGMNKTAVTHNYTNCGTYTVSVKLQNQININVSSEILVLEPVSGLTLDNITGVELFDRKTFTARTSTGNNLTYEWYFWSNSSLSILVCSKNSIEFHFNSSGSYVITVNVSNSISSEYATVSFPVQEPITGLKITAFPNPAPSNSTITFNVSKGSGTFGKYRLDFGDGFVERDFEDIYLFNRTFTSGQRQIILTGENAVSHVIVFYNVTVEDPVNNIFVSVDAEREFFGRTMIAVGTSTQFFSNVTEGTSVFFHWNFGDNYNRYTFLGSRQPSGETHHVIDHVFSREGQFNVSVNASNSISQSGAWMLVHAQEKIEGFDLVVSDRVSPGESLTFQFSRSRGGNVTYAVDFGDDGSHHVTTATHVDHTYNHIDVFNVTATAANQISTQTVVKVITVQQRLEGLAFLYPIKAAETGSPTEIAWKITEGSHVKFRLDFGDFSQPLILDTEIVGMSVTWNHTYSSCGDYQVTIAAYNFVGPNKTVTHIAVVDDLIRSLEAYTQPSEIKIFNSVLVMMSVSNGSRVRFHVDFGDGSDPVNTTSNTIVHQYTRHGQFKPVITAINSVTTVTVYVTIRVTEPSMPLEIRGLNASCQPTIPGNASNIIVSYSYGFLFQCEISFGDGTRTKVQYSALWDPILHTYQDTGAFDVLVRCENELGSQTVLTKANVDEIIKGLKFKNGRGNFEEEFGKSVRIEWVWEAGTNVHLSVSLSGHGSIASEKTGRTGFVDLDATICTSPGKYTIIIELSNSITPIQKLKASLKFVERVSNLTVSLNPIARTGFPLVVYVAVAMGSDLRVNWTFGDGRDIQRVEKGHGSQKFEESHIYNVQEMFLVEVSVTNGISQETAIKTISVMNPVREFTFEQNNTATWPSGLIDFKFRRDSGEILNATYLIEFGNGEGSGELTIGPLETKFTHTYLYKRQGCYMARLVIWNFVSRIELTAPVEILEEISNAVLTPSHSLLSAHPGTSGGGPHRNTFPMEYPVSFKISQKTGTCLLYDFSYGDYHILENVPTDVTEHAYPLPGSYVVEAKVYNKLGSQMLQRNVTLQHSIMGLYLATSGPGRPGENVTFVVFCANRGTRSTFVLDAGEGNNITLRNLKNNSKLRAEKLVDPDVNLPFDPSSYYATVHKTVYSTSGLFLAQVWAWNDASYHSSRATVLVTEKNCRRPRVTVIGGEKAPPKRSSLVNGARFSLTSRLKIDCEDKYEAAFAWVVYKADIYESPSSSSRPLLPPEMGRDVSLPPEIITNQSTITILESILGPGTYIFQLTATLREVGISNADQTYIKIAGGAIEASIIGGDLRSHDWEQRLELDASGSRDTSALENRLSFAWYCSILKGSGAVLSSGLGCFGNGINKVESTEKIFIVEGRRLFEAATYVFTVNVSCVKTGRWSQARQTIEVHSGKPPDVKIHCGYNCGKYLHPSRRLVLTTICSSCDGTENLIYNWTAEDTKTSTPFVIWPKRARTTQNFPDAVILENTFGSGSTYVIRVEARRAGSGHAGFAEHRVTTRPLPHGGSCHVLPKTGVALETVFLFTCGSWQTENHPLTYAIYHSNGSPSYDLAYIGPLLHNTRVIFSTGNKTNNHAVHLMIRVMDAFGASVKKELEIQVRPKNFTNAMIAKITTGPGNQLHKLIGRGAIHEATQLITVISNILNNRENLSTNESDSFNITKQQIRSAMIQFLSTFRPQTLDDVLLGSQALQAATGIPDEITPESQLSASKQYAFMATMLTKEALSRGDSGLIERTTRIILQGLSNILVASTGSTVDNTEDAQETVSLLLDVIDEISSALLHTMRPGENPLVISADGAAIGLNKQSPENLAGISLDLGGEEKFILSSDEELTDKTKNESFVTFTITSLSLNPFTRSNSSSLVKTKPLSLVIKGTDGKVIPIEGLTSPIEIQLPQSPVSNQASLNISRTPLPSGGMNVHKVSIPNNNSILQAEVIPLDHHSGLVIYVRYNEPPTSAEYDTKAILPNGNLTSGSFSLFVPRDKMKGEGFYYFGVLPKIEDRQAVNYTFDVFSSACYFYDEQISEWSGKECWVNNQTTRQVTHCSCTHLTWFGADFFIPPNKLDIVSSIEKLPDLHKYPALLVTFCTVIGLYILGLLWARRRDRKDLTKVGLLPVLDNDPTERYRYEVTVYTARGKHSGTTANVSILITGEDNQSTAHLLKSASRSSLQSGSIDSFLITTPDCLGNLQYVRIWHDNTGKRPSWHLSQVVIRDVETDEKFFFLANTWLACDEGDGQVDRIIPAAGKDELRDFVHLFKSKTSRDFSDGHLWFSIAFRPVRSRFTCVQRVTCCLSLLMCSMLANVMWYNTPVKKQNNILVDLGFFEFTWHEILVGIQSSLIVFPINLLIVQLFRRIAVSPQAKKRYVERTRRDSNFLQEKLRKPTAVSLSDITTRTSQPGSAARKQKHVTLRNLTSIRSPATTKINSWDDEFFDTLLESEIGAWSQGTESNPRKRKTAKEDYDDVVPDILSSDIFCYLYKQEKLERGEACIGSISSEDSVDTTTALVDEHKPEKKTKKKRRMECLFPWWFVYVAWFLCITTAIVAGFFTLLFGLSFDKEKQEQWLVSMFVSIIQDILICQPLKVIAIAIVFALLLKKPQDEDDDVINAELARDEEWLEQSLTRVNKDEVKKQDSTSLRPPDQVLLHAARVRLVKERRMHAVIREIVFYFLFVWVVLLIAYGHRDPYAHFMTQNMENMFVGRQEPLGPRDEDKAVKSGNDEHLKLFDVKNIQDFWDWANQTLVPGLYAGSWYNGQSEELGFLNDKMSFVVGVARIRQLRVKSGTCEVSKVIDLSLKSCDDAYSWSAEDQTPQYTPGWKAANQSLASSSEYHAWRYRTTSELKTRPILGHRALYRGGGYKVDLGTTIGSAYDTLEELKSYGWIDKYTRAIFTEFTVYNSHSNLYCVANLLLEITAAGGSVPFVQLLSTRIDRYTGNFLLFVLVCEISFVLFTIYFTYKEFKRFLKSDMKIYLTEFWTWVEITLICLSWASIVLYVIRFGVDQLTKKVIRENPHQFVDFHYLATADQLFGYVFAFVVFIMSAKFLRLFRFNRRMSLLGSTLRCSAKEMCHFSIIFSLVFVAFSHLCYLLFSRELYKFHTFITTTETLLSVMLGKFSYVSLERTNRILGPIMFFFYSVGVVFILINMFLSIIIENFRRVKENNDLQSNEHEIVEFMTQQLMDWLGVKSRTIFRNRVVDEECSKRRPKYKKKRKANQSEQLKERVDCLVTMIKKVHFDVKENEDFLRNDGEVTYLVPEIPFASYA